MLPQHLTAQQFLAKEMELIAYVHRNCIGMMIKCSIAGGGDNNSLYIESLSVLEEEEGCIEAEGRQFMEILIKSPLDFKSSVSMHFKSKSRRPHNTASADEILEKERRK